MESVNLIKCLLMIFILSSTHYISVSKTYRSTLGSKLLHSMNENSSSSHISTKRKETQHLGRSNLVPYKISEEMYDLQRNTSLTNENHDVSALLNLDFPAHLFNWNKLAEEKLNLSHLKNQNYEVSYNATDTDGPSGRTHHSIDYPMNTTHFKTIKIPGKASVRILISSIDKAYADFLVVQVHSLLYRVILSYDRIPKEQNYVNNTNMGLVVFLPEKSNHSKNPSVYLHNYHSHELSALMIVRNYTTKEPIPGGLYIHSNSTEPTVPRPYLFCSQNLLTTWISIPLASLFNISYADPIQSSSLLQGVDPPQPTPLVPAKSVMYDVYLTYMYEGDLFEDHYWQSIVQTSTLQGVKMNSKRVLEAIPHGSYWLHTLFVSYSGVGAVVNVVASFNGSEGVLYSSTVFFGCDFPNHDKNSCTKLVSPLAKLFCASLLFLGIMLLFFGHRWLNFTMFLAGFLASWFFLFVVFIQIPHADPEVLGICSLLAAVAGGLGWLVVWHHFRRPFFSAILIILLSSFLTAMISTHFLKYAVVPTRHNMAAFVVFPVAFSVAVVGYSIFDIKKVHIFACSLLGSYSVVMPFAFYLGSTLTYIVINIVSAMTITRFSEAVGYPPFQYCDIILLCVWILLLFLGIGFQVYRERAAPPFYPPNLYSLRTVLTALRSVKERATSCLCQPTPDDDSLFEDRPSLAARIAAFFPLRRERERLSAYESFPRIGAEEEGASLKEAFWARARRARHALRQLGARVREKTRGSQALREDTAVGGFATDTEPLDAEDRRVDEINRGTEREVDLVRSP